MKSIYYVLLTILSLSFGCNADDSLTTSELERKIDNLKNEINGIIDKSTGLTSNDCRTISISGGNGCGPIYIYGVVGIDTLALESLFDQLSNTQADLYNIERGPVCDLAFPAKDSLINGTCKACFVSEGVFECL